MQPVASVVVRTLDKASTVEATLSALRRQTMPVEIIVVDSGSTDGTLAIARRWADRVLTVDRETFSYGGSLNRGAEVATAPIHMALSAHCVPAYDDWVERSVAHYSRDDVAATNQSGRSPDGDLLRGPYYQTVEDVRTDPYWGLSNHGSSWRAEVWRAAPFREDLPACEDKEWSWRVLGAGWTIVFDPHLYVPSLHRRAEGVRKLWRRHHKESMVLAAMGALPRPGPRDLLRSWNHLEDTYPSHVPRVVRLASPFRLAEVLGDHAGAHTTRRLPGPFVEDLLCGGLPGSPPGPPVIDRAGLPG